MSSLIGQAIAEQKVDLSEKFIFIASRAFTAPEKVQLEQFGKLVLYDPTILSLSIEDMFAEKKADFIYFNVTSHEDRKYLSGHFFDLPKFKVVFLKCDNEDYDAEWIKQFNIKDPIVLKYIQPCVRKAELHHFLTTFHKVHQPMPFYKKVFHFLF